jgi:hypothetical protein
MADLLASSRFSELDIENLVEQVRDLSKRERDRLLASVRLISHHLLKWDYQPQRRSRRAVSFKLSTADFESINLTEDSQVYLSLTKRVSHNN